MAASRTCVFKGASTCVIKQPPAAGTDSQHSASGVRIDVLSPTRGVSRRGMTQANLSPGFPGRFSLALLISAGLLVRGLRKAQTLDPGFETQQTLVVKLLDLQQQGYDQNTGASFHRQLCERLEALPGVKSVGLTGLIPLYESSNATLIPEGGEQQGFAGFNSVSPNFFETLGIPLLQGRVFSEQEVNDRTPVTVINEAFAQRFWPGQNPLGKRFNGGHGATYEVIGVARNVRSMKLAQVDGPNFYYPFNPANQSGMKILLRAEIAPGSLVGPAQEAVKQL